MDFNSRPHEEVDRQLRSIKCHRLHFNSRPREEVDISYCPRRAGLLLFQLTTSQGGRLIRSVNTANCLYFNSRPHEEVDRIRLFQTVESIISTHDLAKRSTRYLCRFSSSITFQLTTSRRGRRSSPLTSSCTQYFNSRPHEEVDYVIFKRGQQSGISTHDLTKRSTSTNQAVLPQVPFQLTTSRRGRLQKVCDALDAFIFQLTTSRRGRQNNCRRTSHLCIISTHDLTKRSTSLWSNKSITPDPKGIGAC